MFSEKKFLKDAVIIQEGTITNSVYLVRKGQLIITSSELPRLLKIKTDFNQGYFSPTVNAFQLGKIFEGEWAGIEMLVFKNSPIPFSIIAATSVELLEISKLKQLLDRTCFPPISLTLLEKFKVCRKYNLDSSQAKYIIASKMLQLRNVDSCRREPKRYQ